MLVGSVSNRNCCKGFHFKENLEKHCSMDLAYNRHQCG